MAGRVIKVVAAAIERDRAYLITQRSEKAIFPLLWEFPGGKLEKGETPQESLARELQYRLNLDLVVGQLLSSTRKDYCDYFVEFYLYSCAIGEQKPQCLNVRDLKWVKSGDFSNFEFPPADKDTMDKLLFAEAKC